MILIIINFIIAFIALDFGNYPGHTGLWYLFYSVILPAINAVITGISIGFGILIAHKLVT